MTVYNLEGVNLIDQKEEKKQELGFWMNGSKPISRLMQEFREDNSSVCLEIDEDWLNAKDPEEYSAIQSSMSTCFKKWYMGKHGSDLYEVLTTNMDPLLEQEALVGMS